MTEAQGGVALLVARSSDGAVAAGSRSRSATRVLVGGGPVAKGFRWRPIRLVLSSAKKMERPIGDGRGDWFSFFGGRRVSD
ncbi:hypothetical protein NC652_040969 [Populus alba x Populus x berolinensis]|uniref:Uncharacterized protein n=1 Tax=Populus alba x Populus x berolinensis TaxID=444605 RepID=A0AAD6L7V8_9ROSI|nr:hypothetical protein NC652_040385 [Populus alba x Populus x berolinensis]KAJ6858540.1 hypothetical protein NC652_040969 [Populus alba x Populus x berolinensis]KAJ6951906.1 hypothetical protein NC653_041153 [Populus alba x Populus x berolinensis]